MFRHEPNDGPNLQSTIRFESDCFDLLLSMQIMFRKILYFYLDVPVDIELSG